MFFEHPLGTCHQCATDVKNDEGSEVKCRSCLETFVFCNHHLPDQCPSGCETEPLILDKHCECPKCEDSYSQLADDISPDAVDGYEPWWTIKTRRCGFCNGKEFDRVWF